VAYVRKKGHQVVIVHGERDPRTGKVSQRVLFTFYTKAEALRAIGKRNRNESLAFRTFLETEYSEVKFDWPKIQTGIAEHIDVLPDLAHSQEGRINESFSCALQAFAKVLVLADPLSNPTLLRIVSQERKQLEFLESLLRMRLEESESPEDLPQWEEEFFWGRSPRDPVVSPDVEEFAAALYQAEDYDSATAAFELLTDCFPRYAEGHNYLGLIALKQGDLDEAILCFQRTVELGKKNFPKRLSKRNYWNDLSARPYMRGLRNLALTLTRKGSYEEALSICNVLEQECGDGITSSCFRAALHLNRGEWHSAESHARANQESIPFQAALAAFAQYEQGKLQQARFCFLFGALNHPLGVQVLLTGKAMKPRNFFESEDYNQGLETRDLLSDYWNSRSRKSISFFSSLMTDKSVSRLMKETLECSEKHSRLSGKEHKANFQRWHTLRSYDFAKNLASTLDE
jgi:tetratricopeptide (TPR) repeat protein